MAQRGVEVLLYSSKTTALEGGEWSAAHPGRTLPPGKTRYQLYSRLGGPQGRSGRAENLAPNGIRSPDRPARSQSLYRLSYSAHHYTIGVIEYKEHHLSDCLKFAKGLPSGKHESDEIRKNIVTYDGVHNIKESRIRKQTISAFPQNT